MRKILFLMLIMISTNLMYGQETQNESNSDFVEMIFVEGGTFIMGCIPEYSDDCRPGERPNRQVTLSDFYIGKYEVTQEQWKEIMGKNSSSFKGENLPVERVTWTDVHNFIEKLNEKTGENYRLPTEAEWEYAARGGNKSEGYNYSGSNELMEIAWYGENSENKTHPVGSKQPNELGIYDMSGNVWEWCEDLYDQYPSEAEINPVGPQFGRGAILRGGSWIEDEVINKSDPMKCLRTTYRYYEAKGYTNNTIGFRLVRSVE